MADDGWATIGAAVVKDYALARLLLAGPLSDAPLERQLTALRRRLLLDGAGEAAIPALSLLARQGFINEYAWLQDEAEGARVAELAQAFADGRRDTATVLLLASYRALGELSGAETLLSAGSHPLLAPVIKQQVADLRREGVLASAAPVVTPIGGAVTEAVRAQYEANPYPRWSQSAGPPDRVGDASVDILVAGCGTGRSAIAQARQNPSARVLAVDLSRRSLGYAMRMAEELEVQNITFAQADLMELGRLGRTFQVIECSGVLHHLADPVAGAIVLAGLLQPGGSMALGLYSATARRPLRAAKTLAASFPPTLDGVRGLRQAILSAPETDPVRAAAMVGDFFSISTCRDLLMHVNEHELSIPQIRQMLDAAGLQFTGLLVEPAAIAAYARLYPEDEAATNLDNWTAFEARNPATFTAMYRFWARKPA